MSRSNREISHVGDELESDEFEPELEAYDESEEGDGTQSDIVCKRTKQIKMVSIKLNYEPGVRM